MRLKLTETGSKAATTAYDSLSERPSPVETAERKCLRSFSQRIVMPQKRTMDRMIHTGDSEAGRPLVTRERSHR